MNSFHIDIAPNMTLGGKSINICQIQVETCGSAGTACHFLTPFGVGLRRELIKQKGFVAPWPQYAIMLTAAILHFRCTQIIIYTYQAGTYNYPDQAIANLDRLF
jgi:hypothetical protein